MYPEREKDLWLPGEKASHLGLGHVHGLASRPGAHQTPCGDTENRHQEGLRVSDPAVDLRIPTLEG